METANFEQISGMRINDRQLLVFDPVRQSSEGLIEFEYDAAFEKTQELWLLYECKLLYRDYRDFGDRPQCASGPIISRQRFLVYASKRITSRRLAVDKSDYNFEFGSPVDKASRQ